MHTLGSGQFKRQPLKPHFKDEPVQFHKLLGKKGEEPLAKQSS